MKVLISLQRIEKQYNNKHTKELWQLQERAKGKTSQENLTITTEILNY